MDAILSVNSFAKAVHLKIKRDYLHKDIYFVLSIYSTVLTVGTMGFAYNGGIHFANSTVNKFVPNKTALPNTIVLSAEVNA